MLPRFLESVIRAGQLSGEPSALTRCTPALAESVHVISVPR